MKKLLLILILAAALTGTAFAHPPQDVKGEFNLNEKTLKLDVVHRGGIGTRHFIDTITIARNDKEVLKHEISSQINDTQPFMYLLPDAEAGDKLTITVTCNVAGSKVLNLTVK